MRASDAQMPPSPVQNRLPDRLAKAAEPQVAPVNLEDISPIEFLKDRTKGIGVLRATDAVAGAVVIQWHLPYQGELFREVVVRLPSG